MVSFTFNASNTFCISLEKHIERWNRMQARFKAENLEVTRWIATTPATLFGNFHSYLSLGERSCAQSHMRIWQHMLNNNIEYAFILEDDACFDKNWRTKLDEFTIDDPEWDMLLLNASEPIDPAYIWMDIQEQYLTAGYILSIRGAEILVQWFEHNMAASDWMTSRLQQHNHSYSYFPWLIIQEGFDSTLKKEGETHDADHAKVVRCLNEIKYDLSNYNITPPTEKETDKPNI